MLRSSRTMRVEEQLHLAAHRLAQRIVEVGIDERQRRGGVEAAQVQPLAGEVLGQRLGLRILQHAAHLLLEHRRVVRSRPCAATLQQLLVGRRAPEEERQPRRQVDVADAVRPGPAFTAAGSSSMR